MFENLSEGHLQVFSRLVDLGISATLFGMFFFMFLKIHNKTVDNAKIAQEKLLEDAKEDRKQNRESNEKNASQIANAISMLAESHNKLRNETLRQAYGNRGEEPERRQT